MQLLKPLLQAAITVSLWPVICSTAIADAELVYTEKRGDRVYQQTLAIQDGKVRVEVASQFGGYVLFDRAVPHMINIDPARRHYVTVDTENLSSMSAKLAEAREQLIKQMEEAPPERRAQIAKMMGPMLDWQPNAEAPKAEVKAAGKANLAGYDCSRVDIYIGSEKQSELCLVSREKLDVSDADYQTLMSFQTFMSKVADRMPGSGKSALPFGFWNDEQAQLPVHIRHLRADSPAQVFELTAVNTQPLDKQRFSVPEGFRAQAFEPRYQ